MTFAVAFVMGACHEPSLRVEQLQGFPDGEKGIEQGVSACYAGVIDDCLIMAGGCNFPEVPVAEGGTKRYYRGIYAARLDGGNVLRWERVGWLPTAAAYGVSVTVPDGVICLGGNNEKTSLRSVFKIRLEDGKAVIDSLPELPVALDNFTGALHDDSLVVSGGGQVYALDLDDMMEGWRLVAKTDGVRLQAVSGFIDREYCVWGGYSPKTDDQDASLSLDGMCFDDGNIFRIDGPSNSADGRTSFLGGAAAINLDSNTVVAMGGVNRDVFLEALNHPAPDYLTHPIDWYKFSPWVFVCRDKMWTPVGASQHVARAGAALVKHHDDLYLIGGELKPGIRTPSVCRIIISRF